VLVSTGMSQLHEPCHKCSQPAVKYLGSQAWCQGCLDAFLDPIRLMVRQKYGDVRRTAKHEAQGWWLECQVCGATWAGDADEACWWCQQRLGRLREQRKKDLLHPHWLRSSEGNPRYDSLTEQDKRIWNRTRGQTREPQSVQEWQKQLAQAVSEGFISEAEADRTLRRYGF
jgi:hypothetical protein